LNQLAWVPKTIAWCEEHWKLLLAAIVLGLVLSGRAPIEKVFDKLVDAFLEVKEKDGEKGKKAQP
jgi:hypothetical protein